MVRHEDHQRVVPEAGLLERLEHAGNVLVHGLVPSGFSQGKAAASPLLKTPSVWVTPVRVPYWPVMMAARLGMHAEDAGDGDLDRDMLG